MQSAGRKRIYILVSDPVFGICSHTKYASSYRLSILTDKVSSLYIWVFYPVHHHLVCDVHLLAVKNRKQAGADSELVRLVIDVASPDLAMDAKLFGSGYTKVSDQHALENGLRKGESAALFET